MCALNVCLKCTPNCQSRLYTYATRARVRCVYTVYMCVYTLRRHRLRYVSSYVCLCVRSLTHACSYVCSHTRRADMDGDAISRARNYVLQRGRQVVSLSSPFPLPFLYSYCLQGLQWSASHY